MFGGKKSGGDKGEEKKEGDGEETEMTATKKEEAADEGGPAVGEMKRGDYMIHVYLEKGKEFNGGNDTTDPMVEIACLGEKKYSSAKDDIGVMGEVNWSEHIFLEPKNVEKKSAEDA